MEKTKNKLPKNQKKFFNDLSDYLETPLYFYGSVQRDDYFPGRSDIDVDIFTDNESSIITKLQHFLHINRNNFKKFVWRLNNNNKIVYGNKIMYYNYDQKIKTEISIYNINVKEDILYEHNHKIKLPFYVSWLLILLKILYYDFNLINASYYRYLKKKLLTNGLGLPDDDFVVI